MTNADLSLTGVVDVAKAAAHPARLRMLNLLRGGELCVCQVTAILGLAASTVSAHLAELRRSGLLIEDKRGRWVHYRLTDDPRLLRLVQNVLELLAGDPRIAEDTALVTGLRRVSVEVLCRANLDLAAVGVRRATKSRRPLAGRRAEGKGRWVTARSG